MAKHRELTSAERLFLIENYNTMSNPDLAACFAVVPWVIKKTAKALHLKKTREFLSKLGQRPNAGHFSKGNLPQNTLTDMAISTRVDKAGRVLQYIRVGLGKWEELHHYNWKAAGNTVPEGHALIFKDGNTLNCGVENLEVITRAELLRRNRPKDPQKKARMHEKIGLSRRQPEMKKVFEKELEADLLAKRKAGKKLRRQLLNTNKRLANEAAKAAAKKEADEKRIAAMLIKNEEKRKARAGKERHRLNEEFENRRKLPTRTIDMSQLVALRIDAKTVIYIRPGKDPEQVKQKYLNRETELRSASL